MVVRAMPVISVSALIVRAMGEFPWVRLCPRLRLVVVLLV